MTELIEKLMQNLSLQQAAMLKDDVEEILRLNTEQEFLSVQLNEWLAAGPELSDEDKQALAEVAELVATNQLLAQQSLNFARRMLKVLGQVQGYGEDGKPVGQQGKTRVDIRA